MISKTFAIYVKKDVVLMITKNIWLEIIVIILGNIDDDAAGAAAAAAGDICNSDL